MDCDADTLLVFATPSGPVCHTGSRTCFDLPADTSFGLSTLEKIISDRKENPREGSYTNRLLEEGINKIAQKVGEEAVERSEERRVGKEGRRGRCGEEWNKKSVYETGEKT